MVRKSSKRQVSTSRQRSFQPRDLLLAGLGAVSLGRKEVSKLRDEAEAKSAPVRRKALALVKQARSGIEARIAPVLASLGVKKAPAKRSARKRSARSAA